MDNFYNELKKLMVRSVTKYIITLIFLLSFSISYSQVSISVRDTLIPRGEIYDIPINISIPSGLYESIETITVNIEYDARVINIQDVKGDANYLMQCTQPVFDNNYKEIQKTILTITCDDCQVFEEGVLCIVSIQGLVAQDSITAFATISLGINDNPVEDAIYNTANIKVPGTIVTQQYPEGLNQNCPNPCLFDTYFPFNINEPTRVRFDLYYANGGFVISVNSNSDLFSIFYESKDGLVKILDFNSEFSRGSYFLIIKNEFLSNESSSGFYYLIMTTTKNVYNKRFLIIK